MGIELDIETGILTIDEKYEIKPRMTLQELQNSNLVEFISWQCVAKSGNVY